MGLMSSKIEREKLRSGDHIYTWRRGYFYSHHGIYVGDGKVIHLTRGPGSVVKHLSSWPRSQPDHVEYCDIEDFVWDGQLYRFEYGVSKLVFLMKRAGTCSFASSKPPEDVLRRATLLLNHGFGNYHLFKKNCEDFALYCKTGFLIKLDKTEVGRSGQVASLFAAFMAVTIIPYRFLPSSFMAVALVVFAFYCYLRLALDVGSESDFAVEKLNLLSLRFVNNVREDRDMMEKVTKLSLRAGGYIIYTLWALRHCSWIPESTILVWFKSTFHYLFLSCFVSNHLRLNGFKLGEYSAYTIWLLGYLYWRWTSVSKILLWTRLSFLFGFLAFNSDRPRRLKLIKYMGITAWVFGLWYLDSPGRIRTILNYGLN